MGGLVMHPPANRRCQVYVHGQYDDRSLFRCVNEGTRWEKWSGCQCTADEADPEGCLDDFYTWECAGPHDTGEKEAA